jgi:hypothetical protein
MLYNVNCIGETYMTEKYQVGQVLFVIDNSRLGITPIQIVEHHTKTSLEGTIDSYFIAVGGTQKIEELSSIEGPIFDKVELAGEFLSKKVEEKIKKLVCSASDVAKAQFTKKSQADEAESVISTNEEVDPVYVELPDGTKAKLSGDSFEDFNS